MLDIKFIREHPDIVKKAARDKGFNVDIEHVLEIEAEYRELNIEVQQLQEQRNKAARLQSPPPATQASERAGRGEASGGQAKEQNIEEGKRIKEELSKKEHALSAVKEELHEWLLKVPNLPASDVPIGSDETGNKEVKKFGDIPQFTFPVKSHEQLATELDLYDAKRAVKIAGTRAYFLKNDLVLLEQAVLQHALHFMIQQDFVPMTVPWMVSKETLWGTGYFPWGIEDHYTTQDDQGLIGTSEVSLAAYYQDEVLSEKDLPIKLIGISPCFRREVGSYGKDTKGFFRVHQFNKVEQVVLTVADEEITRQWHEKMLAFSEKILQELQLPYRVMLMCTGDMGAGQRKKYDIETWFPSQNKYRETHSASYFNDFQARRLNMRYRTKDGKTKFVYTLNNTVVATPRLLGAILENYQQENGSVKVPKVLQKYLGKDVITKL